MTALPQQRARLLSAEEFAALPEDPDAHYELHEGVVVMSPRPWRPHQEWLLYIGGALRAACPSHLVVYIEIDIDLQLVPADRPGFVRAPDIVVARRDAVEQADRERRLLCASELELVVEVLSPSTRRTDTVVKRGEYADAGIPRYWIVDPLGDEVTITVAHLGGEFGYVDDEVAREVFASDQPFALRLDLTALR